MITKDQPTCFPSDVLVAVSSRGDGTMLDRRDPKSGEIISHRQSFCQQLGVEYDDTVFQWIVYGDERTYDLICEVDNASTTKNMPGLVADALFTRHKNVALMLPVADCVATVIYDPIQKLMALLHLGRHSTLTPLLKRVLRKFSVEGSKPENLIVWMSPNAHASHYVMEYFDQADLPEWRNFCQRQSDGFHLDLQGFNAEVCHQSGVRPENIHTSPINTVTDPNYFSHSVGDATGRFAVVAMMR